MRYLGQFAIKATDKTSKVERWLNLQPQAGGQIGLMDNLGFATSLTYPEAWLVLQSAPAITLMVHHILEINTLVDVSGVGIPNAAPV